jgi:hypothetical protein
LTIGKKLLHRDETKRVKILMSADFDDMASKAKAAHEARTAQENRQDAAQRDEKGRIVDAAIAVLTADVLPLLEKAAAAFRQNGIETKITKDFEVKGIVGKNPSMTFRCIGPMRADGWQFEGPAAFFTSNGSVITVGVAKETYDREPTEQLGSRLPGQSEALITQAVKRALDAYFVQLDKYRSIGVLRPPT